MSRRYSFALVDLLTHDMQGIQALLHDIHDLRLRKKLCARYSNQ